MRLTKIFLFYLIFLLVSTLIWFTSFSGVGVGPNDSPRWDHGENEILFVLSMLCITILPTGWVYTSRMELNRKVKSLWQMAIFVIAIALTSSVFLYQRFAAEGTGLAVLFILLMIVVAAISILIVTFILTKTASLDQERQLSRFIKILVALVLLNSLSIGSLYRF